MGRDARFILQRQVHGTPVTRTHGLELDRSSAPAHLACLLIRNVDELLSPPVAVSFGVHRDLWSARPTTIDDSIDYELNRIEGLALPSYDERCVLPRDLAAKAPSVVLDRWRSNATNQTHVSEQLRH